MAFLDIPPKYSSIQSYDLSQFGTFGEVGINRLLIITFKGNQQANH